MASVDYGTDFLRLLQGYPIVGSCDDSVKTEAAAQPVSGEIMHGLYAEFIGELRRTKFYAVTGFKNVPVPE